MPESPVSPPHPAREEHVVFKICSRAEWLEARTSGELSPSADDRRDGYLHLSRAHQVAGSLKRHFAGRTDLVLLAVGVARLPADSLRWEVSRGGELFPHLYGPLRAASVERAHELVLDADGSHRLPEQL